MEIQDENVLSAMSAIMMTQVETASAQSIANALWAYQSNSGATSTSTANGQLGHPKAGVGRSDCWSSGLVDSIRVV